MIDEAEVLRVYRRHKTWYNSVRDEHKQHRAFYSDDAWQGHKTTTTLYVGPPGESKEAPEARVNLTQVNLVRPWVTSFIASLYYRGVKFVVTPDERDTELTGEEALQVANGVREELNRAFAISDTEDAAERLFTMGLIYRGGLAFKVGVDPKNDLVKKPAEDRIWIEALPPYECVWDRKTRSKRSVKYMGHLYAESIAKVNQKWPDANVEDGMPLGDVVAQGFTNTHPKDRDEDAKYVRILELTAFEEVAKVKEKEAQGEFSVWLISEDQKEVTARELMRGPTGISEPSGAPLSNMVPFISEPAIEFPLDSFAPVKSVVELNHEYNVAASMLSTAFRRDNNRIIMYLKGEGLSEEDITRIVRGEDISFIGIEANKLDGLFEFLDMPPLSPTLLQYVNMLQDSVDRTQLIADFARGKAGEYLSATEVSNLVNYTETTIGRIRKRMDKALSVTAARYLHTLREEMGKSITVMVSGEPFELKKEHLKHRWKIQVVDTASTPAAAAQRQADLVALQPVLAQLAADIEAGGVVGEMAKQVLGVIVEVGNWPSDMTPEALIAAAKEQADKLAKEQPQPTPEAGVPVTADPGAGLQPGDVANSPAAQAIMAQAEAEQI